MGLQTVGANVSLALAALILRDPDQLPGRFIVFPETLMLVTQTQAGPRAGADAPFFGNPGRRPTGVVFVGPPPTTHIVSHIY